MSEIVGIVLCGVATVAFILQIVWNRQLRTWLLEGHRIHLEFQDWHSQRAERLDGRVSRWDSLDGEQRHLMRQDVEDFMAWGERICRDHERWLHGRKSP